MKKLNLFLLAIIPCFLFTAHCFAQADSAKALVEAGIKLNDAGDYSGAIAKYNEALKADPAYTRADYEIGYSLYASGKGLDAIPYLETVLKGPDYNDGAYDMLGSIYDDNNQPDKAMDCYKKGIKVNPGYERLHFNLGISYLREKKYDDAEACEIAAIKLDPKHPSAQRMYAVATGGQGKRMHEMLAWCNYLMLEPNSNKSASALANIRSILTYGIQDKGKTVNIGVSSADLNNGSTLQIQFAVLAATQGKTGLTAVDSLTLQLTEVFKMIPGLPEAQKDTFFKSYYADFFSALSQSANMPAFVRLITLSVYKDDNLAWFKANKKQLDDLQAWIQATPRGFGDK